MNEDDMHHGKRWRGQSVRGCYVSEKFRGARAYWDGANLWSRGGLCAELPLAWRQSLPQGIALDGEVWAGRGVENGPEESEASGALVRGVFTDRLRFLVFDAPNQAGDWAQRMAVAARALTGSVIARPVGFEAVQSLPHLEKLFLAVKTNGGEGLIVRRPGIGYEVGRTANTLKVKLDPALLRGCVRFAA